MFFEIDVEISQILQGNTCAGVFFDKKTEGSACNFLKKETPAQVLSWEFCDIYKNIFYYRTSTVAASEKKGFHGLSCCEFSEIFKNS